MKISEDVYMFEEMRGIPFKLVCPGHGKPIEKGCQLDAYKDLF